MSAFSHHIFVCSHTRSEGHRRGCCDPAGSDRLRSELKALIKSRGLSATVRANRAGCLDQCEHGPVLVIYPQAIWYGKVTPEDLARIVDETVVCGKILDDLLIAEDCLCNSDCEHIRAKRTLDSKLREEKANES